MRRKTMVRGRKRGRNQNLDEPDNTSLSESESESNTNMNNQSESWDCPVSTRRSLRNLIPASKVVVSDRRLSLRSSTRLFETGKTSISTCSRRKVSREHSSTSSAPDDIQQIDVSDTTINSGQANQVSEDSDQVESPSKFLVEVVYPLTMEQDSGELGKAEMSLSNHSDQMAGPNTLVTVQPDLEHNEAETVEKSTVGAGVLREAHSNLLAGQSTYVTVEPSLGHNEAEIVGNSTVGIPKVGELDEAEMSLANHSNQISKQTSNKFEEITNKNNGKCLETAEYSLSLKLTEMVAMVREGEEDEDDKDEVDSGIQSQSKDMVNSYRVKTELMPLLGKIIGKHGDIAKNCITESVECRSALLCIICEIISELDIKRLTNIKGKDLEKMIDSVNDLQKLKVEVGWLHTRLTEILRARRLLKQSVSLKEKIESNREFIEIAESALERCDVVKKELLEKLNAISDKEADWKEKLARKQDESTKTFEMVKDAKSKVKQFLKCSLVDDLF